MAFSSDKSLLYLSNGSSGKTNYKCHDVLDTEACISNLAMRGVVKLVVLLLITVSHCIKRRNDFHILFSNGKFLMEL